MQHFAITLHKSRGRYIIFVVSIIMAIIVGLLVMLALFAAESLRAKALIFLAGMTALVMGLAGLLGAKRSYGWLQINGTIMTLRSGLKYENQSIDLTQVTHLATSMQSMPMGVYVTGQGPAGSIREKVLTLTLTTKDGTKLTLSPELYKASERMKLAPVLQALLKQPGITKEGPVEQAVAIWYHADPHTGAIKESEHVTDGQTRQQARRRALIGVAVILGLVGILILAITISYSREKEFCRNLAANHQSTTAQVGNLLMERYTGNKYDYTSRPKYDIAATPQEATGISVTVGFTVDGTWQQKDIHISYKDVSYREKLYNEASKGKLVIAYDSNDLHEVRPAFEFEPGAPLTLCQP